MSYVWLIAKSFFTHLSKFILQKNALIINPFFTLIFLAGEMTWNIFVLIFWCTVFDLWKTCMCRFVLEDFIWTYCFHFCQNNPQWVSFRGISSEQLWEIDHTPNCKYFISPEHPLHFKLFFCLKRNEFLGMSKSNYKYNTYVMTALCENHIETL